MSSHTFHGATAVHIGRVEQDTPEVGKSIHLKISINLGGAFHEVVVFSKSKDSWTEATKELVPRIVGESIIYEQAEVIPF